MTRTIALTLGLVVGLAPPSRADTAQPCAVRIARAPAAIRAEIERWLAGESSCNVALEVRVVATEGGYYLLARDIHGRVRERVVPDGASAGVLVASWASDDQLGADAPAPNVARPAGIESDGDDDDDDAAGSAAAAAPSVADARVVAPGMSPMIATRAVVASPPAPSKWLRFAALDNVAGVGGTGLRGEVDLWQRHAWSTGVAAAIAYSQPSLPYDFGGVGVGMTGLNDRDIDVLVYIARLGNVTSWLHWRGSLAVGARFTSMDLPNLLSDPNTGLPEPADGNTVRPTIQASLLAGAELGNGWAFELGVLVSAVSPQTAAIATVTDSGNYDVHLNAPMGLQLFGGLAHRL